MGSHDFYKTSWFVEFEALSRMVKVRGSCALRFTARHRQNIFLTRTGKRMAVVLQLHCPVKRQPFAPGSNVRATVGKRGHMDKAESMLTFKVSPHTSTVHVLGAQRHSYSYCRSTPDYGVGRTLSLAAQRHSRYIIILFFGSMKEPVPPNKEK